MTAKEIANDIRFNTKYQDRTLTFGDSPMAHMLSGFNDFLSESGVPAITLSEFKEINESIAEVNAIRGVVHGMITGAKCYVVGAVVGVTVAACAMHIVDHIGYRHESIAK